MSIERTWTKKDGTQGRNWLVNFYDDDGRRRSKSFSKKADAVRFERIAKTEKPKAVSTNRVLTFGDIAQRFVEESRNGRDGNPPYTVETLSKCKYDLRILAPLIGSTPIASMTKAAIMDLRRDILATDFAWKRKVQVFTFTKTILNWAYQRDWIDQRTWDGITIKQTNHNEIQEDGVNVLIHSKEEVKAILSTVDALLSAKDGRTRAAWERWHPIPFLLFYAGLRVSEVIGLDRKNVSLKDGSISITQRISKAGVMGPPKTKAGYRTIYLPDTVLGRIERHLGSHSHSWVFSTRNGTPFDYNNLRDRMWIPVQQTAGATELGFHSARHFYASLMIEAGVDAKTLTNNMGHADEAFTLRVYGHLFDDYQTRERRKAVANSLVLT